jgi:uncharacterized protein YcbK (DUF882 family)
VKAVDHDGAHQEAHRLTRRRLVLAAGCSVCGAVPLRVQAAQAAMDPRLAELLGERRTLWVRRGDEEVQATYWTAAAGRNQDEYLRLCWIMRDVRADRVFAMNRELLDTLAGVQAWLVRSGIQAPIELHSGYRTRKTNNATEGAARDSRHVVGQAADISVRGVTSVKLAGLASVLGRGGTGFYVGRGFVHVDSGDERIWLDQGKSKAAPGG